MKLSDLLEMASHACMTTKYVNRHLKRRNGVLATLLVTVEAKAAFFMATSPVYDTTWWMNTAQAVVGLTAAGYLTWPNIRKIILISSETASPTEDGSDSKQ